MEQTVERFKILDSYVDNLTMDETVACVDEYIRRKEPLHLVGVNADKLNELHTNDRLKQIVNESGIVNADGVSVVWASRFLGCPVKERVAGIDLMGRLLELSQERGYAVYFLGAKQEIVDKTVEEIRGAYPRLDIVGWRNGYFTQEDWPALAGTVKEAGADIVFIGISSPLKEYLVDYMLNTAQINAVLMGVGGSFDVISGEIPRAPWWMQRIGMEWFFRFLQEPRRLWKRYFLGNILFTCRIVREKYRR